MRFSPDDLVADDAVAIDVEGGRCIVDAHHLLGLLDAHTRNWERKLHLIQIPLQPLRILVDAHQQERNAGIVLVFRVRRF